MTCFAKRCNEAFIFGNVLSNAAFFNKEWTIVGVFIINQYGSCILLDFNKNNHLPFRYWDLNWYVNFEIYHWSFTDAFSNGYDSSDEEDDDDDDSDDQDFVGSFADYYKSKQDFRKNRTGKKKRSLSNCIPIEFFYRARRTAYCTTDLLFVISEEFLVERRKLKLERDFRVLWVTQIVTWLCPGSVTGVFVVTKYIITMWI